MKKKKKALITYDLDKIRSKPKHTYFVDYCSSIKTKAPRHTVWGELVFEQKQVLHTVTSDQKAKEYW